MPCEMPHDSPGCHCGKPCLPQSQLQQILADTSSLFTSAQILERVLGCVPRTLSGLTPRRISLEAKDEHRPMASPAPACVPLRPRMPIPMTERLHPLRVSLVKWQVQMNSVAGQQGMRRRYGAVCSQWERQCERC